MSHVTDTISDSQMNNSEVETRICKKSQAIFYSLIDLLKFFKVEHNFL